MPGAVGDHIAIWLAFRNRAGRRQKPDPAPPLHKPEDTHFADADFIHAGFHFQAVDVLAALGRN